MVMENWPPEDREDLELAVDLLENPGLMIRVANVVGMPIEGLLARLPGGASAAIAAAGKAAIEKALEAAVLTLGKGRPGGQSRDFLHKMLVTASGAGGGLFGLPGLSVELPISTTIMLRSIADIARSEGEDLTDAEARMACVTVFALGGRSKSDDASESAYWAVRAALAKAAADAAAHVAKMGMSQAGAPVLARFIAAIATRFNIVITEKVAAQMVPAVGAIGGATINVLFMDHFQDMARGHFITRRLERIHGAESVEEAYRTIRNKGGAKKSLGHKDASQFPFLVLLAALPFASGPMSAAVPTTPTIALASAYAFTVERRVYTQPEVGPVATEDEPQYEEVGYLPGFDEELGVGYFRRQSQVGIMHLEDGGLAYREVLDGDVSGAGGVLRDLVLTGDEYEARSGNILSALHPLGLVAPEFAHVTEGLMGQGLEITEVMDPETGLPNEVLHRDVGTGLLVRTTRFHDWTAPGAGEDGWLPGRIETTTWREQGHPGVRLVYTSIRTRNPTEGGVSPPGPVP